MTYYDIICPSCFRRFGPNNVVFRKVGHSEEIEAFVDPYVYHQELLRGNPGYSLRTFGYVDPAILTPSKRVYQDNLLVGVVDDQAGVLSGVTLKERLCPYCHAHLHESAGRQEMQIVSVTGFTHAGKTTYEAALLSQLLNGPMGLINGNGDRTLERNIKKLQENPGKDWDSTDSYLGPYVYDCISPLADPKSRKGEKKRFTLVFYDLPGEKFSDYYEIARNGRYIAHSYTCIFLVDLQNLQGAIQVFDNIATNFLTGKKKLSMNLALLLYKSDQLGSLQQSIPNFSNLLIPRDYSSGAPVKSSTIDSTDNQVREYLVKNNHFLQQLYKAVLGVVEPEQVRWFIANAIQDGRFRPCNCDEPLLWSLARQGLYPQQTSIEEGKA